MVRSRNNSSRVHFDPKIKELTINLWLAGKTEKEIEYAIRNAIKAKWVSLKTQRRRHRAPAGESRLESV